jgi:hypothetical protein
MGYPFRFESQLSCHQLADRASKNRYVADMAVAKRAELAGQIAVMQWGCGRRNNMRKRQADRCDSMSSTLRPETPRPENATALCCDNWWSKSAL